MQDSGDLLHQNLDISFHNRHQKSPGQHRVKVAGCELVRVRVLRNESVDVEVNSRNDVFVQFNLHVLVSVSLVGNHVYSEVPRVLRTSN